MFDKRKFAHILNEIIEYYQGQKKLIEKSGLSRTMISYYLNQKKDKPPKPETLEKIANASGKITTYKDLMIVCGYVNEATINTISNMYKKINDFSSTSYHSINLSDFNEDEIEKNKNK